MDFKTFYFAKSVPGRDEFASRAGTSRGLLTQVAYGNKSVELGFADVIVALSGGVVDLDGVSLTENAKRQRELRMQRPRPASRRAPGRQAIATNTKGAAQ